MQLEDSVSILHKELECKVEIEFKHMKLEVMQPEIKKQIWNFHQVKKPYRISPQGVLKS